MPRTGGSDRELDVGELRKSQLISTFGPGAIVDLPHISGIIAGLDLWEIERLEDLEFAESAILNDEEILSGLLGKKRFIQPISLSDKPKYLKGVKNFGIPVIRYPKFYYCQNCHVLGKYKLIGKPGKNGEWICCKCEKKLIPSRFVAACLNGHLTDFPYDWWIHRGHPHPKNTPKNFTLEYNPQKDGLGGIMLKCKCGAKTTMEGAMGKDALCKCDGSMPWLGSEHKREECNAQLRTMQRSAGNMYYPINESVLTIPPWSEQVRHIIRKNYKVLEDIMYSQEEERNKRLKEHFKRNNGKYACPEDTFIYEVNKKFGVSSKENTTDDDNGKKKKIIEDEYDAFCGEEKKDPDFKTQIVDVPKRYVGLIERVNLVKRLREVQVLKGFRRILPECRMNDAEKKEEGIDREYMRLSETATSTDWLPAIELFGEGIFIKFNETSVKKWEESNKDRYNKMTSRIMEFSPLQLDMFSSDSCRFVLLHTFAHLFIRRVAYQCGYATASLKEKIYSTINGRDRIMSGVLIYTASSDNDGSLGGLVRQGQTNILENTLDAMLQDASWCSNDPVCIDSEAQGFKSMNYAACHACALLPETSCSARNCLLDRASVVGTPDEPEIGFFKDIYLNM